MVTPARAYLVPALACLIAACGSRAGTDGDSGATDAAGEEPAGDTAAEPDAPDADVPDVAEGDAPDAPDDGWSVTFFVVGDTHCDPDPDPGHVATVAAIERVAAEGTWPTEVDGAPTGFDPVPVGEPAGVVIVGDLTGSGDVSPWSNELETFRRFFENGYGDEAVSFPAYVGLGNHDLDRDDLVADMYREQMWQYVEDRHMGPDAPVPVGGFDPASRCYAWDWEGLHLVQLHKHAGDTTHGHASGLAWLADDLSALAPGHPVVLLQHYGLDAFGMEDRWWTDTDRADFADVIGPHRVIAIVAGHSHYAMSYVWDGWRVIQVNNAKAEIGEGNDDGNGSFAIIRVTDTRLDMITCRWLDETGAYEFVMPGLRLDI